MRSIFERCWAILRTTDSGSFTWETAVRNNEAERTDGQSGRTGIPELTPLPK